MVVFDSDLLPDTRLIQDSLKHQGKKITLEHGQYVTRQYEKGHSFYLLEEGKLSVAARKDTEDDPVYLGNINLSYAPIGWTAFNEPNRYSADIKIASPKARLIQFDLRILKKQINDDLEFAIGFYQFILHRANFLIAESLSHLAKVAPTWLPPESHSQDTFEEFALPTQNLSEFLQKTPFFEVFDDRLLSKVAHSITRRDFRPGDIIAHQGQNKDGFYLLDQGWVDFTFEDAKGKKILFRSISTPGFNVGWMGLTKSENYATIIARRTTSMYHIDECELNRLLEENKELALLFFKRLLWLVNHQIQMIRARFLTFTFDIEWIAVKTLIEANATRLSLNSKLHEVPHLLKNKQTQKRAFDLLHELHDSGISHERHIASLALDNLQELSKEHRFYNGLINVYQQVTYLPDTTEKELARKLCALSTIDAFDAVDYTIEGWENLPEESGHIFIYNHLKNHPYNTLPNNFQVTLDSHFISSLISYKKYEDPGLRVVRVGKDIEYGHQEYYEKLGHIDVYTSESEERHQTSVEREIARQKFYEKAADYLMKKKNLIISPEGTSYETSESPGVFRSGAFRLAMHLAHEPMIIPVVMANFDKRARNNQFRCRILKPYKMSDFVNDATDKNEMKEFLSKQQDIFKKQILDLAKN
jgi:CRP-like cAMP-binding protein